jgi:hypothetical protein
MSNTKNPINLKLGERILLEENDTEWCEIIQLDGEWAWVRFEGGQVDRFRRSSLEPHAIKRRYVKKSAAA